MLFSPYLKGVPMGDMKKGGAGITRTPFADAIAKPKGGLSSPAPSQNNKSGKK